MSSKKLSSFRLHTKAVSTHKFFRCSNVDFSILKSKDSKEFIQFYVVDANWKKNISGQITPLAYIILNNTTDEMQFPILQPDVFSLDVNPSKLRATLETLIKNIEFSSELKYCYN